ncbi:MAG: uroporphyrinogen-III synthase [Gammaproteobacteria bacterium]|jgi:uroporphyrinogen-III synthase
MPIRPRILVTRPAAQARGLCERIQALGGEAVELPAIEIRAPEDSAPLEALADRLEAFDLAVFISVNAVQHGLDYLLARRSWPASVQIAAVGLASNAALERYGLRASLVPVHEYSSEGLLALDALADMRGRRVVILRGNGGRDILFEGLSRRGARVEYVEVYRRARPDVDPETVLELLQPGNLTAITATSNETLQNLFDMAGATGQPLLRNIPLVVASPRQAAFAGQLGFKQGAVIAGHASDDAMAAAIESLLVV